jgi:hypothetical protein
VKVVTGNALSLVAPTSPNGSELWPPPVGASNAVFHSANGSAHTLPSGSGVAVDVSL